MRRTNTRNGLATYGAAATVGLAIVTATIFLGWYFNGGSLSHLLDAASGAAAEVHARLHF